MYVYIYVQVKSSAVIWRENLIYSVSNISVYNYGIRLFVFLFCFFSSSFATEPILERPAIERTSQHPDSLQQIQQFEDYSRYQRSESVDESTAQRPVFIRPLRDLGELQEGRNAHFEAQLTPVSDPTMKVEWYKDGRPITASKFYSICFAVFFCFFFVIFN